jgi:hypothetical protein
MERDQLHRLAHSPPCLGLREVERVQGVASRLGRRSLEGGQAVRQALGTHPPSRRRDTVHHGGTATNLALAPSAKVHHPPSPRKIVLPPARLVKQNFEGVGLPGLPGAARGETSTESARGGFRAGPGRRRRLGASRGRGDNPRSAYSTRAFSQKSSDFVSAPRGRSCPQKPGARLPQGRATMRYSVEIMGTTEFPLQLN